MATHKWVSWHIKRSVFASFDWWNFDNFNNKSRMMVKVRFLWLVLSYTNDIRSKWGYYHLFRFMGVEAHTNEQVEKWLHFFFIAIKIQSITASLSRRCRYWLMAQLISFIVLLITILCLPIISGLILKIVHLALSYLLTFISSLVHWLCLYF